MSRSRFPSFRAIDKLCQPSGVGNVQLWSEYSFVVGLHVLNCELVSCIFGYVGEFPYRAVPSAADRPNFGHSRPPKSEGRRTHP